MQQQRRSDATTPSGTSGAPWLISFVDMISLLLTFMIVVYASADISDPTWQPAAAALRAGFNGSSAPATAPARVGEAASPAGLKPGYLAFVLGDRLRQMPLFTRHPPVYDAAALRLTLPTAAVFAGGVADADPAAAQEFARLTDAIAPVANAVAVIVAPDPAAGLSETSSAADWEGAIGRALVLGRALMEGGLEPNRLSLLAGGGASGADGIRVVVEADGGRL